MSAQLAKFDNVNTVAEVDVPDYRRLNSAASNNSAVFRSGSADNNDVLVIIEINFGPNKKDDIVVRYGDDPAILAADFVRKHNIKQNGTKVIEAHIRKVIEDHENKIFDSESPQTPLIGDSTAASADVTESSVQNPNSFDNKLTSSNSIVRADSLIEMYTSPSKQNNPAGSNVATPADSETQITPILQNKRSLPAPESEIKSHGMDNICISSGHTPITNDLKNSVHKPLSSVSNSSPNPSDEVAVKNANTSSSDPIAAHNSFNRSAQGAAPDISFSHLSPIRDSSDENKNNQLDNTLSPSIQADKVSSLKLDVKSESQNDDQEDAYNKMKNSWKGPSAKEIMSNLDSKIGKSKKTNLILSKSNSSNNSQKGRTTVSVFATDPKQGKLTANERLYRGASLRKERLDAKISESVLYTNNKLAQGRECIKLKGKSKEIIQSMRQVNSQLPVGDRLYKEAFQQKTAMEETLTKEEIEIKRSRWSCPKCCTYHNPLSSHAKKATDNRLCNSCGWTGIVSDMPFKPIAVELQYELSGINREDLVNSSYKRHGIENIADDQSDFFEYLHRDDVHNKETLNKLQNKWAADESILKFKPDIPEESRRIVKKINRDLLSHSSTILGDSEKSYLEDGKVSKLSANERLYRQRIACQDEISVASMQSQTIPPVDFKKQEEFVNRLTYEYEEKEIRDDDLRKLYIYTDQTTGKPLFKPVIPPHEPMYSTNVISQYDNDAESKIAIHDKLLKLGHEHKVRQEKLREEFWRKQIAMNSEKSKHVLPESNKILEQSSETSIGEIFKVLLTCQMHNDARNLAVARHPLRSPTSDQSLDKEILLKISSQLTNWKECVLDMSQADPEILIEPVQRVLSDVIDLSKSINCNDKYPDLCQNTQSALLLDFNMFLNHVRTCIQKREGGGKSYLFLPKRDLTPKRPEPEPTFRPKIDSTSVKIVENMRRSNSRSVEEIILKEHESAKKDFERVKLELESERNAECTFQPTLFKAPKGIQPKYRLQKKYQDEPPPPPPYENESDNAVLSENENLQFGNISLNSRKQKIDYNLSKAHEQDISGGDFSSLENSPHDSITVPRLSIQSLKSLSTDSESAPSAKFRLRERFNSLQSSPNIKQS